MNCILTSNCYFVDEKHRQLCASSPPWVRPREGLEMREDRVSSGKQDSPDNSPVSSSPARTVSGEATSSQELSSILYLIMLDISSSTYSGSGNFVEVKY